MNTGKTLPITEGSGLLSPGFRALTIAGVTMVGVEAFEMVAVSTAMPTVTASLAGLNQYALAFGVPAAAGILGMVTAGVCSDRRGPVRALTAGWLLFVAGLIISGTAVSMSVLIAGRAFQGMGTGLTTVAIYVVVGRTYPEALRPRVFSSYAAAWVLPALLGPAVAGFLVVHAGWRWVFLSVPFIALAAAVAGWGPCRRLGGQAVGNGPSAGRGLGTRKIGFAAIAGAAACLLSVAGQYSPALAIPLSAFGIAMLVISVPRLLPRTTYRSGRGLPTVILLRGLVSAAFAGAETFLPLLLSRERGLSPTKAGIVLTVGALGWSAGSALQGRISSAGRRPALLRIGFGLLALGILLASATVWPAVPLLTIYPSWVVAGIGTGIAYPTLSVLTLELSAPADQGANSSALQVNDALLQAITLAISGTVFAALIARSHTAPYLAGFAISAAAATTGVLLAARVRVVAHRLLPGQSPTRRARAG